jgi:hypothetical protein
MADYTKYIWPLLLLATLAGVAWIVFLAVWLLRRSRLTTLKRVAVAFMCLGLAIPLVILPLWTWINQHGSSAAQGRIQDIALTFWPTSIELMALDSPGPPNWIAITIVYAVSILGNIGAYGTVGFIVGWVVAHIKQTS